MDVAAIPTEHRALRTPTRADEMKNIRAFFEPYELSENVWDASKMGAALGPRYGFLIAARAAFWAMSDLPSVGARVRYLCEATEYCVRANAAARDVDVLDNLDMVGWYGQVMDWIALAQSYLREDVAKLVKPANRGRV